MIEYSRPCICGFAEKAVHMRVVLLLTCDIRTAFHSTTSKHSETYRNLFAGFFPPYGFFSEGHAWLLLIFLLSFAS